MRKNEVKTIVRHIDRLARNLNARGRRRYADGPDQQQKLENAKYGVEVWTRKPLNPSVPMHAKYVYPQYVENEEFDKLKKLVQKDLKSGEEFIKSANRLITFCNIAIKAQRG